MIFSADKSRIGGNFMNIMQVETLGENLMLITKKYKKGETNVCR